MKKLLLVDDSLTVLNALKYRAELGHMFSCVTASSYTQAEEILEKESFFAAIVDLMLPDCEHGDAVKLAIRKKIPTIIMTASMNDELRKKMLQLPIVDYLFKDSIEEINRAVALAEELIFFKNKKVLILESNRVMQKLLTMYFEQLLCTPIVVDNPAQCLEMLRGNEKIAIVTINNERADINGSEFVKQIRQDIGIRKNRLNKDVILFGMTSSDNEMVYSSFIKNGVNDILRTPFSKEQFNAKVINVMKLVSQQDELQSYIDTVDEHVITSETEMNGKITYVSKAFERISGYTKDELLGRPHSIVRHPSMAKELYEDLWKTIQSGNKWHGEILNRHKDGSGYWVDVNISPKYDGDDEIIGYRAIRTDITDKKRIEELSIRDPMTNLFNRRHLTQTLPLEIQKAKRNGQMIAFMILDVDKFKEYNDTYGHQSGDDVLIKIGSVLMSACKRASDFAFRMGGEEFAMFFLPEDTQHALIFADKVRADIQSLGIEHHKNPAADVVTASIGLICAAADDIDVEVLYQAADVALYEAKESGRNRVIQKNG
ncbi:MAG: diguanylate cyclase [Sulfuricurvum sp.]|nr:diguanylate cyclase [Sulfuricurvum sp.]